MRLEYSGMPLPIPWYVKFGVKLALGSVPGAKQCLPKLLPIFRHGPAGDPVYCRDVFLAHFARFAASYAGAANRNEIHILEMGPGYSLASGLLGYLFGAKRVCLVDVGKYAAMEDEFARRLIDRLESLLKTTEENPPAADLSPAGSHLKEILAGGTTSAKAIRQRITTLKAKADIAGFLFENVIDYRFEGLQSLRRLPDASIQMVFSQAVLEHVARSEFSQVLSELYRIVEAGGVGSHVIDFKDHLGASLNSLRFSERFWETGLVYRSGFYTNRYRKSQAIEMFESAGWQVSVVSEKRWDCLPLSRSRLHEHFQKLPEDDLLCGSLTLLATKPTSV